MPDAPVTVSNRLLSALKAGDMEQVCALIDPKATIRAAGGLPYSGEYEGPDGLLALFGKMLELYDLQLDETTAWALDDERVLVRALLRLTSRASGAVADASVLELHTVRDGLIADIDAYYKDPSAVTAL